MIGAEEEEKNVGETGNEEIELCTTGSREIVEEKDDEVKSNLPFRDAQHTHIRYVIALSYSPHLSDIYKTY